MSKISVFEEIQLWRGRGTGIKHEQSKNIVTRYLTTQGITKLASRIRRNRERDGGELRNRRLEGGGGVGQADIWPRAF